MKKIFLICMVTAAAHVQAQDSTQAEIDPAKPTNFYTQVNAAVEYSFGKADELFGTRFSGQYTFNPKNLLLFELPLLNNTNRNTFGLGDIRLRYFGIVKKDYTKTFPRIATVAPSVDIYLPTGSFRNGLGSSSMVIAPGLVWGWFFNAKTQVFPIISYQYITKPSSDLIPDEFRYGKHGLTFQALCNYSFSKKTFLQLTPIYAINDLQRGGDAFTSEVKLSYMPSKTSKLQLFVREEFTRKQTTINGGYTVYL